MSTTVFRFRFRSPADLAEAETTLHLSILAAEGLFGEARTRTDVSYRVSAPDTGLLIDASTPTGVAVVRILTAFLSREFGAGGFSVGRVPDRSPSGGAARRVCEVAA